MSETVLVNGTDLATFGVVEMVTPPAPRYRGDNLAVPGRAGAVWVPKVLDSTVLTVGLAVHGFSATTATTEAWWAQFNQTRRDLKTLLVNTGAALAITYRLTLPSGSVDVTGTGEYQAGLEADRSVPWVGRFAIQLLVTAGDLLGGV